MILTVFVKRCHAAKIDIQLMACGDVDGCSANLKTMLDYVVADRLPVPGHSGGGRSEASASSARLSPSQRRRRW